MQENKTGIAVAISLVLATVATSLFVRRSIKNGEFTIQSTCNCRAEMEFLRLSGTRARYVQCRVQRALGLAPPLLHILSTVLFTVGLLIQRMRETATGAENANCALYLCCFICCSVMFSPVYRVLQYVMYHFGSIRQESTPIADRSAAPLVPSLTHSTS